jgi:tryptophan-rich sensory protein
MKLDWISKLLISIIICLIIGGIGSIFTTPSIPTWYAGLAKPSFNPPNWLFAPVWTALFILMGISLYLIWNSSEKNKHEQEEKKAAIILFSIQLALNLLWSIIFFTLKMPSLAFMEIMLLWASILFTLIQFYKISKTAGLLMVPYILWVSFASILNLAIALLN